MTNEHSPLAFNRRFRRDDGSAPTIQQIALEDDIFCEPFEELYDSIVSEDDVTHEIPNADSTAVVDAPWLGNTFDYIPVSTSPKRRSPRNGFH
ncbi:hypothetical protein PM082_019664 [Marasmius tenuissimus]|nr:hypothetical protein PM082_019664 [Marasmius tenuissimus]